MQKCTNAQMHTQHTFLVTMLSLDGRTYTYTGDAAVGDADTDVISVAHDDEMIPMRKMMLAMLHRR